MIEWGEIDPDLRLALEQAGLGSVDGAFALSQGQDLSKPDLGTRRRTRLTVTDSQGRTHELYLKRYGPRRWWRRLGKFTSPARREFGAIRRVRQAGVPTMQALVMGEECPLMDGRSFLVVTAVPGDSLEREGSQCFTSSDKMMVGIVTRMLADVVRQLHDSDMVHRDLYACHVFLHSKYPVTMYGVEDGKIELALIDLARVFIPRLRKFRWRVKDLAQLHYSMPSSWVEKDWRRFLLYYLGPERAGQLDRWQRAIVRKSESIRRHQRRKTAAAGKGATG